MTNALLKAISNMGKGSCDSLTGFFGWLLPFTLLAFILAALMTGCGGVVNYTPGKTTGKILVGSPKVSTRERLLNDRLEHEAWLASQLKAADDQDFGLQGVSDVRSFVGMVTKADVNIDPTQAKLYRKLMEADQEKAETSVELARLDRQIQILEKQRQLKDLQSSAAAQENGSQANNGAPNNGAANNGAANNGAANNGAGSSTDDNKKSPVPDNQPSSALFQEVQQLKEKVDQLLPSPSRAAVAAVRVSPLDNFSDRLAYRTAIRSEILENALDDRHDLGGNSLLRLSFDATVLPESDSSAWALVEVCVVPEQHGLQECYSSLSASEGAIRDPRLEDLEKQCLAAQNDCAKGVDRRPWCSASGQNPPTALQNPDCKVRAAKERVFESNVTQYHRFAKGLEKNLNNELSNLLVKASIPPASGSANTELEKAGIFLASLPDTDREEITRAAVRGAVLSDKINLPWLANIKETGKAVQVAIPSLTADQFADILRQLVSDTSKIPYSVCEGQDPKKLRCAFNIVALDYVLSKLNEDPEAGDLPLGTVDYEKDYARAYITVRKRGPEWSDIQRDWVAKFAKGIDSKTQMFVYAVTPKETTERISDVASRREVTEFVLQLSALLGNVGGAKAATDYVKANEAIFQALRRQPLVVGFSRAPHAGPNGEGAGQPPTFGWVLGPRYGIAKDGKASQFRHVASQHALSALISVPSWWKEADVVVKTYWLSEDGIEAKPESWMVYKVVLPSTTDSMVEAVKFTLRPKVDPAEGQQHQVQMGEPATLLITGSNLWRNTVVTLGAQKADRIEVLPNMKGILARFERVSPAMVPDATGRLPLVVWTSQGKEDAGEVIVKQPVQAGTLSGAVPQRYLISQMSYEAELTGSVPSAPVELVVARAGTGEKTWLPVTPFDINQGRIRYKAPTVQQGKLEEGDQVTLALVLKDNFNGDPRRIVLSGAPVLYSALPRVTFSAKAVNAGTWFPQRVEVQFPRNAELAFPGLDRTRVPISVASTPDQQFGYQITGPCQLDETNKCSVLLDILQVDSVPFQQHAETDKKSVRALFDVNLSGANKLPIKDDGLLTLAK